MEEINPPSTAFVRSVHGLLQPFNCEYYLIQRNQIDSTNFIVGQPVIKFLEQANKSPNVHCYGRKEKVMNGW